MPTTSTNAQPLLAAMQQPSATVNGVGTSAQTPLQLQRPSRQDEHTALDISSLSGKKPAYVAAASAISYILLGVICFHFLLDLTWVSAFYFAVTTSLTVGYGDIDAWAAITNSSSASDGTPYTPNDGAIMFTMLYIVGGMIVMGTSLGLLLQSLLEANASEDTPGCASRLRSKYPLLLSALLCVACIIVGAAFIVIREGQDVVHGLYFAIVTISTVGYGSGHPTSDGGRAFVAVFMLIGVSCMGNFIGELADRPLRAHRAPCKRFASAAPLHFSCLQHQVYFP